jgi:hypothetical protein
MSGIQYTLAVNRLSNFVPNEEGDRSETFHVVMDQWIAGRGNHPETRLIILESPVADSYRYAVDFPQEVALLETVTFSRANGKAQLWSRFPDQKGELQAVSFWQYDSKGEKVDFLQARDYILYEQQEDGRWQIIKYDGNKLT